MGDVDTVANDVGAGVQVADQAHRPEVDADPRRHLRWLVDVRRERIAQAHRDEEGVFGVAEEVDGDTVTGIENNPVCRWYLLYG